MKLRDWMLVNGVNGAELGRRVGRGKMTVSRWLSGECIPDRESMPKIVRATAGQVTANDFHELPASEQGSQVGPEVPVGIAATEQTPAGVSSLDCPAGAQTPPAGPFSEELAA